MQDIIAYLDDLNIEIESVGLEAGTLTQYLTYGLQAAGFVVICMEARQAKGALSGVLEILCQSFNLYGKRIEKWQRSLILKQP